MMTPITTNSKSPLKVFSRRHMILKLEMKHEGKKLYKVHINHDPGMTTFLAPEPKAHGELIVY